MVEQTSTMERATTMPELASGVDGCERLLSAADLPEEVAQETRRRLALLAPELSMRAPGTRIHPVWMTLPGGWRPVSASIAGADDGYRMLVQSSNWTVDDSHRRVIHDARGIARSVNYLIDMRVDFSVRGFHAVHEPPVAESGYELPMAGLEHCRLFAHRGDWWLSTTVRDQSSDLARTALGRVDGPWLADKRLLGDAADGGAADWIPAPGIHGGRLRFIASIAPTVVLTYDHVTGASDEEVRREAPAIASRLRGSSPAIPWNGGRLCLARDEAPMPDGRHVALHRLLWFDPGWTLARISAPFYFIERGAEIATGLAARDGQVVITFGIDDREAKLAVMTSFEVESMLAPPLALDWEAVAGNLPVDVQPARPPVAAGDAAARGRDAALPTIAAVTISGNSAEIIGDALRSVADWVDWFVLVDTGISDDTVEVARAIAGAKLIVRKFPWRNDFSAARNFALAAAAETGADWAVIIDTDERLRVNGVDVRQYLAETMEPALLAPHGSGEYTKDRFFRLPAWGEFRGPTHEAFYRTDIDGGARVAMSGVIFDELVKSDEQLRRKRERDRDILQQEVQRDPSSARSFFYLGDALQGLGQIEEAVAAFQACGAQSNWDEEAGWAMLRAAECLVSLGRLDDGLEACAIGMTRHPGIPELPWYAGRICLFLGRAQHAVYWARLAVAAGRFAGFGTSVFRMGWGNPYGQWEGPYDVLRTALGQLGDEAGAAEAGALFERAVAARVEALRKP